MSSLSLRMSALFCCRPSDYMNTLSPRNCLRHLEAVRFKDLCRYLRHMLKDYLIRLLLYYTRTSLNDIIKVHCKQILCKIMKIALLGNIKYLLNIFIYVHPSFCVSLSIMVCHTCTLSMVSLLNYTSWTLMCTSFVVVHPLLTAACLL